MAYLRREGDYAVHRRPHLILLDLNMPGGSGRELLMEIKRDPDFRSIPVLVVSGADSEADVAKVYDLGANAFLAKPQPPDTYAQLLHQVEKFWFKHSLLPGLGGVFSSYAYCLKTPKRSGFPDGFLTG